MPGSSHFGGALGVLILVTALSLLLTGIAPHDRATWVFELLPGTLLVAALAASAHRLRFAGMVYAIIAVQVVVLAIGAQWTYAQAPPGAWMQAWLGLERNPFDRVGHVLQGAAPALMARELLVRVGGMRRGVLLGLVCVLACLGFSGFYEILEWGVVAAFYPQAGPEWLGMQGDPWDAQADMLMALLGATAVIVLLGRRHDAAMSAAEAEAVRGAAAG